MAEPNIIIEFSPEIWADIVTRAPNLLILDRETGERFGIFVRDFVRMRSLDGAQVEQPSLIINRERPGGVTGD